LQVTKFPGLRLRFLWLFLFCIHMGVFGLGYAFTAYQGTIRFVNCSQCAFQLEFAVQEGKIRTTPTLAPRPNPNKPKFSSGCVM
jgi:hypothetical protein